MTDSFDIERFLKAAYEPCETATLTFVVSDERLQRWKSFTRLYVKGRIFQINAEMFHMCSS